MELHWRSSSTPLRHYRLLFTLIVLLGLAALPTAARADHGPLELSLISDLTPGTADSEIGEFTELNGALIFTLTNAQLGRELWRSDGTTAGTQLVKDINPGPGFGLTGGGQLSKYKGQVYFNGCVYATCGLWKSDGTTAGTTVVTNQVSSFYRLVVAGDTLFILGGSPSSVALYASDGTAAGTVPASFLDQQVSDVITSLGTFGNRLAFLGYDDDSAKAYVSDGTEAGTEVLLDVPLVGTDPFERSVRIFYFIEYDGKLFFVVRNDFDANGQPDVSHELWSSDGTAAGTALVKDLGEGEVLSSGHTPVVNGGLLFFEFNKQLWKSDGTAAGTQTVLPSNTNDPPTNPRYFIPFNGAVYFEALTNQYGVDLWKSDGTAAGTTIVKDLSLPPLPAEYESYDRILGLTLFDDELYFLPKTEAEGVELWKTDGTAAGTVSVVNINPGPGDGVESYWSSPAVVGDALFFPGNNGQSGREPFRLGPAFPAGAGPVALYTFEEGSGRTVQDVSGVGSPLDLQLSRSSGFTWVSGGLRLNGGTALFSSGPASKIIDAARASEEVTVEAWVTPANVSQYSARIATISGSATSRNLSLIHGVYDTRQPTVASARIRTSSAVRDGGRALLSPTNTLRPQLVHLVFTRSADGMTRMYADGVEVAGGNRPGTLASWDTSFRLALGGEVGGGNTWRGTFHRVAFYDRALSASEVDANFDAGPNPE